MIGSTAKATVFHAGASYPQFCSFEADSPAGQTARQSRVALQNQKQFGERSVCFREQFIACKLVYACVICGQRQCGGARLV